MRVYIPASRMIPEQLKDKENKRQKKINEMLQWGQSVQTMAEEIDAIHKQKEALKRRMEA